MSRVLLFAHRLSHPSRTGVVRYANELGAALDALEGDKPDYTMASTPEPWPLPWSPRTVRVRRARGPRRPVNLAWTVLGRPRVELLVGPTDLVHVLDPSVPVPTRAPLVYTIHDLMPVQHPEWFERGPRWAFAHAVAQARRQARLIITDSAKVAQDVVDVLGVPADRVRCVPCGIGDAFRTPITPDAVAAVTGRYGVRPQDYLLYVGTVSVRKNLPTLVEALRLSGGGPLVVAGPDGLGADSIRADVRRAGLEGAVRFIGFVAEDDLPVLMAGASALLHPASYEGFGFTPLEAMATGTPVAASNAGSLPEVVGDAGILVDPHDVDAWAAAITTLRDDDTASRLVAAGRARSARYTWDATAVAVRALHEEVLHG